MNADDKHHNWTLAFLITVSMVGLLLSIFFVFHPFAVEYRFEYRKLVAGIMFSILCVLGMLVAIFPSSCSTFAKTKKLSKPERYAPTMHEKKFQAHHPICENFSLHILAIGNMKFCATCSGLLVGAAFVLFGTSLYFFLGIRIYDPFITVLVGAIGVFLGLIQSALAKFSNGWTRFFSSILFVVGAFLMFVSLDEAVRSISVDLFFVALSALLILTRIAFSQKDHQRICSQCLQESCK